MGLLARRVIRQCVTLLVTTQPEGARHFIDRNALRPGRYQTPDYALKAAKCRASESYPYSYIITKTGQAKGGYCADFCNSSMNVRARSASGESGLRAIKALNSVMASAGRFSAA
jgi:hypothetical protein